MPLHVKEKSEWKTVKIPEDVLNGDDFHGLVDIQELTDYELVPFEADLEEKECRRKKSSRSRKRKREDNAGEEGSIVEAVDEKGTGSVENSGSRKKKRKMQRTRNTFKEESEGSKKDEALVDKPKEGSKTFSAVCVAPESEANHQSTSAKKEKGNSAASKKNKKKAKPGMVNSWHVEIVTTEESFEKDNEANRTEKTSTLTKKSKRKKKNKALTAVKEHVISDIPNVNEGNIFQAGKKNNQNQKNKSQSSQQQLSSQLEVRATVAMTKKDENETPIEMTEWKDLFVPEEVLQALQDLKFAKPTVIQKLALPSSIRDRKDILGAAETGSGKTLAFGIPLLSRILDAKRWTDYSESDHDEAEDELDENENKFSTKISNKNPPMALILEPTRELAVQVRKHLVAVSRYTNIKFANVVGGMSVEKQRRVLSKSPEVIIATPGRLWQLIEEGNEHLCQVDRIQCLVLDEADRMVEKGHYEELTKLFELIKKSPRRLKNRQTFVMSATLTMDISAPKRLMNKKKKSQKEEDKIKSLIEKICNDSKPKVIDLTPADKVAQTLTELRVNCKADEKDFYLYYFLCQHPGRTLVFVNSKDCLRRLINMFSLLQCSPLPLHADMHQRQRLKNLDKFSENSKALLVASDVAARGLDIPHVDHVIHYQVPRTMENYVHRSGRTARASNLGLSVMLVGPEDAKDYRKIIHGVRNGEELPLMPVELDLMPSVRLRVAMAREVDVTEYRMKKKKVKNNFFIKAAEEMDMIIDDNRLLEDLGDSVEQAESRQRLAQLKARLANELKSPLAQLHMTKYPTKSGQLATKSVINLFTRR